MTKDRLKRYTYLVLLGAALFSAGCAVYPSQIRTDQDDYGRFSYFQDGQNDVVDPDVSMMDETGGPFWWGSYYGPVYYYRTGDNPHRFHGR